MKKSVSAPVTLTFLCFLVCRVQGECRNIDIIPFGKDSLDQSNTKVCGWRAILVEQGEPPIDDLGLPYSWYALDQDLDHFKPMSMPMALNPTCPQISRFKETASRFPGAGDVYLRREFEIDSTTLNNLQDMEVRYIVDGRLLKTYMNGHEYKVYYPDRSGCQEATRPDHFAIPASYFRAGKNVFAIHAQGSRDVAFLDLKLSFQVCTEGEVHSCSKRQGPAYNGCRARCEDFNFCRNKDHASCDPAYHADFSGNCLCGLVESLSCSGEMQNIEAGQCYPSPWMKARSSRMIGCPPETESGCE